MSIEEHLFPKKNQLVFNKETGFYETEIVDIELDNFKVYFINDGTFQINTEGYKFILLDSEILHSILLLSEQANELYKTLNEKETNN